MKPEWWTNGKSCSRIPKVIEIWREQGCEVTPLYSGAALLDAHQRGKDEGRAIGRREGMEEAADYVAGTGGVIPGASVYAPLVSGNNQPCASGDPRDRIPNLLRRRFDYATSSLAHAIRAKAQEVTE